MQSEFGGVSEMQQFMVDSCSPSLFSSPPPPPQNSNPNLNASTDTLHHHHHHHHHYKFNPVPHHHPLHIHPQPTAPSPHFAHFGQPIPITQQLFHQQQQQQQQHFQLFHHHLGPENSNSSAAEEAARMMGSGGGGFLAAAMNFKLGVNESSSTPGPDADEDDGILQGPDDGGSESRLHSWHTAQEDDSPTATATASIKEPFWRPLDIDYINPNNKRPAESQKAEKISSNDKLFKKLAKDTSSSIDDQNRGNNNYNTASATTNSNYKLFSELEAIYKPGTTTSGAGGGGGGGSGPITNNTSKNNNNNRQTGSGSAVTGDDNPIQLPAIPTVEHQPDNGSDSSNGGQNPSPVKPHKNFQKGSSSERRKRAKRRLRKQLTSIANLFESLVKQLMDHEENLHQKFLQVMEKRDKERSQREEAWRKQEAAKVSREAAIRAQERALSASRESAIISFLEKITGETFQGSQGEEVHKDKEKEKEKNNLEDAVEHITQNSIELYNADDSGNNMIDNSGISSSRWPKAEVQALIRVRSGIESRFQEPGLKGPLWEEVSTTMRTLGYIRSAKRCKEKWENINKYFRKMKDSGRKRPMHSKTCPYFHQLGQLYSKSLANNNNAERNKDANSELLDAIVVSNNENIKFSSVNRDEGEKEEEDEINEEEGEGDNSQEQAQDRDTFLNQEHYQLFNSLRSSKCSEVIMKCQ